MEAEYMLAFELRKVKVGHLVDVFVVVAVELNAG
jgi:hypothetical protein